MTKKLVSLLFILALVATSIFAINTGVSSTIFEYKSYSHSQINTQGNPSAIKLKSSAVNKITDINSTRTIQYSNYNTTLITNQNTYKPGDNVNVTGTSSVEGFNGSVSLSLISPLNEKVVSPQKSASAIFFNDSSLQDGPTPVDWQATPGLNATVSKGYLNLTSTVSTTTNLSYITHSDLKGTFLISFNFRRNVSNNVNLTLTYWNGTNALSIVTPSTSNVNTTFSATIYLDTTNPSIKPLNITLTGATTFIVYPIQISYNTPNIDFSTVTTQSGTLQNIWLHGNSTVYRNLISIQYHVNVTGLIPIFSFNFTLPLHELYPGEWQFIITVHPVGNNPNQIPKPAIHNFIVPISIQYPIYFDFARQYVYRGYYSNNETQIYKDETNITKTFSPNDRIVYVGKLFTNITGVRENLDNIYFNSLVGTLYSNTTIAGTQPLAWTNSSFTNYYSNSSLIGQIINQVLPNNLKNNFTWIIPTVIPTRGIYGTVNQSLQLTIPSYITTNASNGQTYSPSIQKTVNIKQINVEFNLSVSKYNLPFSRTWFLTEFMEGNFTIQTTRYNATALQALNNVTNQTFTWTLAIPRNDILFSVYLMNSSNQIEQNLTVTLLPDFTTFYFGGLISPNLNTQSLYHMGITWINPVYSPKKQDKNVEFSTKSASNYSIKGTLTVSVPLQMIQYRQGDNLIINFNVTIDQLNNKPANGLILNAVLTNNTYENNSLVIPQIVENGGRFTLLMTLPESMPIGIYGIQIYKASTHTLLATLYVKIIPHEVDSKDIVIAIPIMYSLLGALMGLIILLGFLFQFIRRRS